ncbi:BREX-1 system adenine-specific DNA-methyltransferase PglX [Pseudomonas sp. TNT2022 ID1044]|uniref:BREX-1 system adenine-specific DNA-methyltransferase PglX n=1 Tax=Pseudomonas sp. TNT2022 ID1044 TaxID=2942636 RepID=UPI00235FAE18|nr:BREX-1 system adenine-specific DNA-methyltransferase PglX [Pseudomonas sp. TNT2022 ID1044]MDD0994553.1 BREX-1 system adenine-specific DNA-methyltransferase PglX [Pseudomonas sp. TNT2022 ID1044]
MNTGNIKRYAPKARTAFIAAMTKRAALFGIRESSIPSMGIEPLEQKGDLALIGNRPFPASIIRPRAALVKKVEQMGFAQAMEQAAYSWFNRLCAIRFMELKGYLDHGRRVLSHPEQSGSFQILNDCLDIELEGLDHQRIAELKLDGTKDEELYRELLLAQCHALHKAMPFLFEAVDDATELLLPDNLTKTDSLIRELVSAIPEQDWQDVEIIGWLYQFYISEKKDQVIGKVVKSEDIPAATQLFTPNWIVQYLVQNSLGRQWLQAYPDSPLRAKMPYYIESAEQTPEVQIQLAAITPDSIDPKSIKVLDPACGSGHILVVAYKVLKEIYTERGHRSRDIPKLILEHNLFGLDIDDRAGQLAGFALMMLAREDDRGIFGRTVNLNVLSLQESHHLDLASLWQALNLTNDWQRGHSQSLFDNEQTDLNIAQADNRYQLLQRTLARFTQARTVGSLIEVAVEDAEPLSELLEQLRQLGREGDSIQKPTAKQLIPYVQQAWMLAQRYDAVIANPPYMSSKGMNADLKSFAGKNFPSSKADLFAVFMERTFGLLNSNGYNAQVNMQSWMFLSSYEKLREWLLSCKTITNLMHIGYNSFPELNSKVVQCCAWVFSNLKVENFNGKYIDLNSAPQSANKAIVFKEISTAKIYTNRVDNFKEIPGKPFAYWTSTTARRCFSLYPLLSTEISAKQGLATTNNDFFTRRWYEVSYDHIGFGCDSRDTAALSKKRWFPMDKGGNFRKWYGNNEFLVDWENDGERIKSNINTKYPYLNGNPDFVAKNASEYFKEGVTWSKITSGSFSCRYSPAGAIFSDAGMKVICAGDQALFYQGLLSSKVFSYFLSCLSETLNYEAGNIGRVPVSKVDEMDLWLRLIDLAKSDWDNCEISVDFVRPELIKRTKKQSPLPLVYNEIRTEWRILTKEMQTLEERNNSIFIERYGLGDELNHNVLVNEVTLFCNPEYRYGSSATEKELEARLQSDTLSELISYTIGCIMGRYSLDREGLVYAHTSNKSFAELVAEGVYKSFPADSDGILPLTDLEWFADDATNRFREFVRTVWGDEHMQENLDFVAESLCLHAIKSLKGKSSGESSLDTIRRYLSTQFFKDHLKTYKKRPIYWLFSSGKHKAFECLVYLHRYNEGTLARMRTEYVIPLTAKLNTYTNKLATDIENESVTSEKKRLEKELATLHNQQAELATFDEKLRHYADQRISLDLNEGVKVNYGKFGDLLAEVKAITGGASD